MTMSELETRRSAMEATRDRLPDPPSTPPSRPTLDDRIASIAKLKVSRKHTSPKSTI